MYFSQLEIWHVKQFDESLLPAYSWVQETGRTGWIEETRLQGWEGGEKDQNEWNQEFGGLGWNEMHEWNDNLGLDVETEDSELRKQLADWAVKEAIKLGEGASKTKGKKRRKYNRRSKSNGTTEENQNGQLVELGGECFSNLESGFQVQGSGFLKLGHQDLNHGNLIAVPAPIFVMFGFPTGAQY